MSHPSSTGSASAAQQQQQQAKKAAKYASPQHWVEQIKQRQLSQMSDGDRVRLLSEAENARSRVQQMAECRKVAARSKKVAEKSAASWSEQSSMKARRDYRECEMVARTEQVQREAEDEDAEMDSMPTYMVAQAMMMPALLPAAPAAQSRAQASALIALTETTAVAPRSVEALDERKAALADLKTEPRTDGECAAKFKVFERFSTKVDDLRKSLVGFAATAGPTLPPAPRQAVERDIKKLDDRENMQIPDQSPNWFVHDMTRQLFTNIDKIQDTSAGIERKVALLREQSQSSCPICLETFLTAEQAAEARAAGDDDEDLTLPRVLTCCHSVCEPCWKQWVELKGVANAFCPLCKNREFLEDISRR